jgi:hypothetical protein
MQHYPPVPTHSSSEEEEWVGGIHFSRLLTRMNKLEVLLLDDGL